MPEDAELVNVGHGVTHQDEEHGSPQGSRTLFSLQACRYDVGPLSTTAFRIIVWSKQPPNFQTPDEAGLLLDPIHPRPQTPNPKALNP